MQRPSHVSRRSEQLLRLFRLGASDLAHRDYGLAQMVSLPTKNDQLQAPDEEKSEGENREPNVGGPSGPPLGRRSLIALFSVAIGTILHIKGWENLNDKRRFWSAALISGGWLLAFSGFMLWFLTGFPATWGWWL
jgi:hypothetical protein